MNRWHKEFDKVSVHMNRSVEPKMTKQEVRAQTWTTIKTYGFVVSLVVGYWGFLWYVL